MARNPAYSWALLFIAIQYLVQVEGYDNENSRWATMLSMVEDHSFRIDHYYQHTIDWAMPPNGHYYSNKAPGPALLGYPLFWVMDKISTHGAKGREARDHERFLHRASNMHLLSVLTQAIPYALVVLLLVAALQRLGFSPGALHLTALALLFGNTGSLFMNLYFGHGMTAMFVLAMLLALHHNRLFLVGLFFGLATLCDYSAALFLPPLFWAIWRLRGLSRPRYERFLLGGILPGALFAYYHIVCFGSPFSLPNKFQNPQFVDIPTYLPNLWGVLRFIPQPEVIANLLWGPERGLLYTQPWVLLCALLFPFVLWRKRGWIPKQRAFARWTTMLGVLALVFLLGMNGSFGGWHGGATPGPRYLSIAFPPLALAMVGLYARAGAFWRQALAASVALSVVLFVLFFSATDILAQPDTPLLPFYLSQLNLGQGKNLQRCLFMVLGFGWAGWRAIRSSHLSASSRPLP